MGLDFDGNALKLQIGHC